MNYWPFDDADRLPDEMWNFIELDRGETPAEAHFVRVLWFHHDFMNGGLNQVMYNLKVALRRNIEDYAESFDELGLTPLATIARLADRDIWCGSSWQSVFNRKASVLDDVYSAIVLGLPMTCKDRFSEYLPRVVEGQWQCADWVEKAALKYAREHYDEFSGFVAAYRDSQEN